MMNLDFSIGKSLYFQDGGTPIGFGIKDLHNTIMYYMIMIVVVLLVYSEIYEGSVYKIENREDVMYNSVSRMDKISMVAYLEIFWTIIPSVILVKIAIPSFSLLYSIDEIIDPEDTIKVIGNQWYWSCELNYVGVCYDLLNSRLKKNKDNLFKNTENIEK